MALNNEERAAFGGRACEAGTPDYQENDPHTNLVDALANLRHWAQREELDFGLADEAAHGHFAVELAGFDA